MATLEHDADHLHKGAMSLSHRSFALLCIIATCSCVPAPPAPEPTPPPAPPPPPPPAPVATDWRDWPVATGNWSYRRLHAATAATFGQTGQPPLFSIRCDLETRAISFHIPTALPPETAGGQMTIRTSFGDASWPVAANGTNLVATRANNDATLDAIAFSRGRFAVSAPGATPLALPNWAEIGRLIEDCRGR